MTLDKAIEQIEHVIYAVNVTTSRDKLAWRVIRAAIAEAAAGGCACDSTARALSASVEPLSGTPALNTSLEDICPKCKSDNIILRWAKRECLDCGHQWL